MADGGGPGTQVQTTKPPPEVMPYILGTKGHVGVLPEAERLYLGSKPEYFPGSTVAGFAPEQELAMSMGAERATSGSPLNMAAGNEVMKTLSGGYMGGSGSDTMMGGSGSDFLSDSNPYIDMIRQRGARDASRIAGQFGAGGRTGSGMAQGAIAEGYTNAVAPYEYGSYENMMGRRENERGRIADAARFAPQLAAEDWRDIGMLEDIGAKRRLQGQRELGDEVNRWDFEQNREMNKLKDLMAMVYGYPGSTSTTTVPGASGGQQALGAGLGIASILPLLFMSDKNVKEDIEPADTKSVVDKLIDLPISEWSYIDDPTRHVGPMAQDFQEAFGVGDGKTIHMADVAGVLLSAGKEMARRSRGLLGE